MDRHVNGYNKQINYIIKALRKKQKLKNLTSYE